MNATKRSRIKWRRSPCNVQKEIFTARSRIPILSQDTPTSWIFFTSTLVSLNVQSWICVQVYGSFLGANPDRSSCKTWALRQNYLNRHNKSNSRICVIRKKLGNPVLMTQKAQMFHDKIVIYDTSAIQILLSHACNVCTTRIFLISWLSFSLWTYPFTFFVATGFPTVGRTHTPTSLSI